MTHRWQGIRRLLRLMIFGALVASVASVASAQTDSGEDAPNEAEEQPVDEIVVFGEREGDPDRLEHPYRDKYRDQLLKELEALKALEEESAWRNSDAPDPDARIRWGYDPQEEYRKRRDSGLYELPYERVRPATVLSIRF